jgi:hypothetical protein
MNSFAAYRLVGIAAQCQESGLKAVTYLANFRRVALGIDSYQQYLNFLPRSSLFTAPASSASVVGHTSGQ